MVMFGGRPKFVTAPVVATLVTWEPPFCDNQTYPSDPVVIGFGVVMVPPGAIA